MSYEYQDKANFYYDMALSYDEDAKYYRGEASRITNNHPRLHELKQKAKEADRMARECRNNGDAAMEMFRHWKANSN